MVLWYTGFVFVVFCKNRGVVYGIFFFFSIIYFGHKNYLKEHGCPYEKRIFKYQIRSELDLNVKKKINKSLISKSNLKILEITKIVKVITEKSLNSLSLQSHIL